MRQRNGNALRNRRGPCVAFDVIEHLTVSFILLLGDPPFRLVKQEDVAAPRQLYRRSLYNPRRDVLLLACFIRIPPGSVRIQNDEFPVLSYGAERLSGRGTGKAEDEQD